MNRSTKQTEKLDNSVKIGLDNVQFKSTAILASIPASSHLQHDWQHFYRPHTECSSSYVVPELFPVRR